MYDNKRVIVAPVGYARTGKDEFAKVLVQEYGFKRFAFADKLRDCIYALNPIVDGGTNVRLREVIDYFTWDNYKSSKYGGEIRELLQRFGTEVGRDLIDTDIWVRELDKVEGNVVITDCRFDNEYQRIKKLGGKVVRIHRPGVGPVNDHISERGVDLMEPDHIIRNDADLKDFALKIREFSDTLL